MALGFDPYAVLGVARDATDKQIRQARHELVRKYHPDVNHSANAAARFEEVQDAFELLSDPEARAKYDRTHDESGRERLVQGPDGGYHLGGEASSRFFIEPASVDFGVLTPDRYTADAKVTIAWIGEPPTSLTRSVGGDWWTVQHPIAMNSCFVFTLRASRYIDVPNGRQQAQFAFSADGTAFTVPLTAEFQGAFPTPSQRDYEVPPSDLPRSPREL